MGFVQSMQKRNVDSNINDEDEDFDEGKMKTTEKKEAQGDYEQFTRDAAKKKCQTQEAKLEEEDAQGDYEQCGMIGSLQERADPTSIFAERMAYRHEAKKAFVHLVRKGSRDRLRYPFTPSPRPQREKERERER